MLHTKFRGNQPAGSGVWRRRFLKGFYHTWAWWPSWSCDQHQLMSSNFHFLVPESFHTKFSSDLHGSF